LQSSPKFRGCFSRDLIFKARISKAQFSQSLLTTNNKNGKKMMRGELGKLESASLKER
jgi:hypothetical protein